MLLSHQCGSLFSCMFQMFITSIGISSNLVIFLSLVSICDLCSSHSWCHMESDSHLQDSHTKPEFLSRTHRLPWNYNPVFLALRGKQAQLLLENVREIVLCLPLVRREVSRKHMPLMVGVGGVAVLPQWRTFKIHPLIISRTGTTHFDHLTTLFPSLLLLGPPPNFITSKFHHCCPSVHSCRAISRSTGALTEATSLKKLTLPIPEVLSLQKNFSSRYGTL